MDKMYLRIHTVPTHNEANVSVGDTFEIVDEDENLLAIMVGEYEMAFTKETDALGNSYATWFDIITEVE